VGVRLIEVHLYGKLRRFTDNLDPARESIIKVPAKNGDTIGDVARRIGIPREQIGTNIFHNGEYRTLERKVQDGDRVGLFPPDMSILMV